MENKLKKLVEVRFRSRLVNLAAMPLTLAVIVALLLLTSALPHHRPMSLMGLVWFFAALAVLLVLHELTHAWAFSWLAKLPWNEFKYGFNARQFLFYCHCVKPLTIRSYRCGTLAPLLVLGPVSVLALVACPADWLAIAVGAHLGGCLGDVMIVASLRGFDSMSLVLDHPTEAGCDVYISSDAAGVTDHRYNAT